MNSRKLKLALAAAVTIVIFATLTLVFWEFMRDRVVTPLYYLLWVGDLFIRSVPQGAYLALLVFICLLIGSSALQGAQTGPASYDSQRANPADSARYVFWRRLHDYRAVSELSRNHFAWEARKLILTILAYQEGVSTAQAEKMILDGSLSAPDAVHYLIQRREIRSSARPLTAFQKIELRLRSLFFRVEKPTDPLIDQQVDEIVAFIEHRLELTHAGNQPESRT